jgi:hypothetical protein
MIFRQHQYTPEVYLNASTESQMPSFDQNGSPPANTPMAKYHTILRHSSTAPALPPTPHIPSHSARAKAGNRERCWPLGRKGMRRGAPEKIVAQGSAQTQLMASASACVMSTKLACQPCSCWSGFDVPTRLARAHQGFMGKCELGRRR